MNKYTMWHNLTQLKHVSMDEVTATVSVPSESPWFSGHFPDNPILPGIAQLGMVVEAIRQACDHPLKVTEFKRVRFKQLIRPDQQLELFIRLIKKDTGAAGRMVYGFRILAEGELACNGQVVLETVT